MIVGRYGELRRSGSDRKAVLIRVGHGRILQGRGWTASPVGGRYEAGRWHSGSAWLGDESGWARDAAPSVLRTGGTHTGRLDSPCARTSRGGPWRQEQPWARRLTAAGETSGAPRALEPRAEAPALKSRSHARRLPAIRTVVALRRVRRWARRPTSAGETPGAPRALEPRTGAPGANGMPPGAQATDLLLSWFLGFFDSCFWVLHPFNDAARRSRSPTCSRLVSRRHSRSPTHASCAPRPPVGHVNRVPIPLCGLCASRGSILNRPTSTDVPSSRTRPPTSPPSPPIEGGRLT